MKETLELRDIIEIVLKGKWLITLVTLVCLIASGVVSWFVLPVKYESKAVVQVANGVQDTGIIANYVATEFTPLVFKSRLENQSIINTAFQNEKLENTYSVGNLNIKNENNTNLIELAYKSDSAENAQKELETIIASTKNEMNIAVQETLNNLEATYSSEANSISKEIDTIINEYNSIVRENNLPEILILQTVLNSEIVIDITEEQINALSNVSGELQNQLLQLQAQIQVKSEEYRKVLANYQSVKTGLDSFRPDPFIRVITEPTLASNPASPNNVLNLALGLLLGLVISLGLVFFRYYWKNSANK